MLKVKKTNANKIRWRRVRRLNEQLFMHEVNKISMLLGIEPTFSGGKGNFNSTEKK